MKIKYNYKEMISWVLFYLTLLVSIGSAYEKKCPASMQWHYRSASMCKDETSYLCLFHQITGSYKEECNGPDGIQRGFKLVLRPNIINSQCAKSRYQPLTFRTTGNSDCAFSRSICTEEGLVVHNIGTHISDTTCRCDYRTGYTFVNEPKNKCYCLPFEEDCSCYRRKCRPLTQDYICLQYDTLSLRKCPVISSNRQVIEGEEFIDHNKKEYDIKRKDSNIHWSIILTILVTIIIIFGTIIYCMASNRTKSIVCGLVNPRRMSDNIGHEKDIQGIIFTGKENEKKEKKVYDVEKADSHRSLPIPQDYVRTMENFLKLTGLERFYPKKLMLMDAISIRPTKKSFELKSVALKFVENIVIMNCTCRDQMLLEFMKNIKDEKKEEDEDKHKSRDFCSDTFFNYTENDDESGINPLDLLLALFKCSSPMLRQVIANKLFMCKLAIPFILPNFGNEPVEMCVWPLRSIILESRVQKKTFQDMSVECPCTIVSFVRIGCPSVSKSKLLNEILTDQYHNTFSNRDCPLGTAKRIISDGMVEAAWYIPSNKSTQFRNMTMFLNLRGNAISYTEQLCGMSQLTDILVVFVLLSDLEDKIFNDVFINMFTKEKGVVLAIDAFQIDKKVVKEKLQNFTKTIENYERIVNVCILSIDGHMRSTSIIKTEISEAISGMMKQNIQQSVHDRLPRCLIATDEETLVYKTAKSKASKVFNLIPNIGKNVKETVVPLQGSTWSSWSQKLRYVNESSNLKSLHELGTIKKEMYYERQKQLQICQNMGPFMKSFLDILSNSIQSDEECTLFVLWLKQFLDQRSRSLLPEYLSQYQTDWKVRQNNRDNKTKNAVLKKCKEDFEKTEYKLVEASFGFEYLSREMGQIYESIDQCKPDAINLKKLANFLPVITAKLLLLGQPFEIMDGEVANVPLCWVKSVLQHLKNELGNKKLLALSVLGMQSSGKSTLLNTMFGLQFAVNAGKCTKGVFIQLVPTDIAKFKFDYVLVIDTDGLTAPELANQKHRHDNELATFVIGLGDITIVNIKGENTAEMKDVLQIAVHAFMRLKLTNEKLSLQQTCVFVHQNVPSSDAHDKRMLGRQKFVEVLDEMTKEAAEQEQIPDIHSFNQVIKFDSEENIWYLSDLWHGDPPMAPANLGYSNNVCEMKEAIIFRLTNLKDTYLTITDTTSRIEDLWYGILKDDLIFSFRNNLELKAYYTLDQQCRVISGKLEKYVFEFIESEAQSKLVSCWNEKSLEIAVHTIMLQLTKEVNKQIKDLNSEMDSFVDESTLKDIMIQWTQDKRNRLSILAESLIMKAKTAVNNNKQKLKIQKLREKTKHEMEINNMVIGLALQMKGQVPSESVLKKKFNVLWYSIINKSTTKDITDIVPIKDQIKSLLCKLFPSDAAFIYHDLENKGCRLSDAKAYQNMKHLDGTLTKDDISENHFRMHKPLYTIFRPVASSDIHKQVLDFTKKILRKIDLKLEEIDTDGILFDLSYVTEILYIVSNEITDFNQHTRNEYRFDLLPPFRTMILNHVVLYAIVFFTRMHDSYKKRNSPNAQIEQYKGTAWELFKNATR